MADTPHVDEKTDGRDDDLVAQAQQGDRLALEELVRRHQAWVYGLAQRMLGGPDEAEDASQEILIKMVTKLSTFRQESSFRTWLYRIGVNHVLNRRRGRWERRFASFERHRTFADGLKEEPGAGRAQPSPEDELLVEETKSVCLAGMLLCLDRTQRLLQVNNVNAIALGKDIRLHLGVPAAGAVSKVDARLQQSLHLYDSH